MHPLMSLDFNSFNFYSVTGYQDILIRTIGYRFVIWMVDHDFQMKMRTPYPVTNGKMPRYRQHNVGRRSTGRSRYPGAKRPTRGGGYLDTAARALAVAYAVKKLINVEFFNFRAVFTVDPNTSGAVVNLTAIAQGDDDNDRQGNKIRAKYIQVQGNIKLNASTATDTNTRMVIVRDNNGSTSQPAISDLYSSVAAFIANKPPFKDPQSNSRFSILMDKWVNVNDISTRAKPVQWSMSLDHHIYFTGGAATDEGKGHLYLFIASSEATADPVVAITSVFRYLDN